MNNFIYFLASSNCDISSTDKLLICVIILLFITIVWTILVGIMFKLNERRYYNRLSLRAKDEFDEKYYIDEKEDIEIEEEKKKVVVPAKKIAPKTETKTETKKETKVSKTKEEETYVKIRFYRSDRTLIYIAPKNMILKTGDKIKVRVDKDTVRTATVVKGNYTRKVYKNREVKSLELSS
jgi:hypothetical protein